MKTFYEQLHYAAERLSGERIHSLMHFVLLRSHTDDMKKVAHFLINTQYQHNGIAQAVCQSNLSLGRILTGLFENYNTPVFTEGMEAMAELLPAVSTNTSAWRKSVWRGALAGLPFAGNAISYSTVALFGAVVTYRKVSKEKKEAKKHKITEQAITIDILLNKYSI